MDGTLPSVKNCIDTISRFSLDVFDKFVEQACGLILLSDKLVRCLSACADFCVRSINIALVDGGWEASVTRRATEEALWCIQGPQRGPYHFLNCSLALQYSNLFGCIQFPFAMRVSITLSYIVCAWFSLFCMHSICVLNILFCVIRRCVSIG